MKDRNFLAELLMQNAGKPMVQPSAGNPLASAVMGQQPQQVLATQQSFTPTSVLDNRQMLANSLLKQASDRGVHPIARGLAAYFGAKATQDINAERTKTEEAIATREAAKEAEKSRIEQERFDRTIGLQEKTLDTTTDFNKQKLDLQRQELDLNKKKIELDALQKIKENEGKLSAGQEALDKEFAKEYADFKARGGYADVQKSLEQLKSAKEDLQSAQGDPEQSLSGPIIGITPDFILAAVNPQSIDTREKVQEVAQRNLRLVLGAQFTEKEGERLIKRVYNESLDESTNAERLDRLFKQIDTAAQVKEDAVNYFEQNGSLKGWQGIMPTLNDFEPEPIKKEDKSKPSAVSWEDFFK